MREEGYVKKGWGAEYIFATTDEYCGKLLNFKEGSKCSMHFHVNKKETWFVKSGSFLVRYINTRDGTIKERILNIGSTWTNEPLVPHQLICLNEGTIIETSTPDSVEDNYRVLPGDSQA